MYIRDSEIFRIYLLRLLYISAAFSNHNVPVYKILYNYCAWLLINASGNRQEANLSITRAHTFCTYRSQHGKGCWTQNRIVVFWIQQLLFFSLWFCQLAAEYVKYCSWNYRYCSSSQNDNNLADRQRGVFPSSWVLLSIHFDSLVSSLTCI